MNNSDRINDVTLPFTIWGGMGEVSDQYTSLTTLYWPTLIAVRVSFHMRAISQQLARVPQDISTDTSMILYG